MKYCTRCGKIIADGESICSECKEKSEFNKTENLKSETMSGQNNTPPPSSQQINPSNSQVQNQKFSQYIPENENLPPNYPYNGQETVSRATIMGLIFAVISFFTMLYFFIADSIEVNFAVVLLFLLGLCIPGLIMCIAATVRFRKYKLVGLSIAGIVINALLFIIFIILTSQIQEVLSKIESKRFWDWILSIV